MAKRTPAKQGAASNSAQPAERKRGGRRPLFKESFVEQARKLCQLGAVDEDLADFFGVNVRSIERWKVNHEAFGKAVLEAKTQFADAHVEHSLYRRARGYTYDAEKIFQYKGEVVRAPYREHVPPDVQAIMFWLMNRKPADWRSKSEITGANGGPIQTIDVSGLTPVERQQRIAALLAMNGGAGPVIDG